MLEIKEENRVRTGRRKKEREQEERKNQSNEVPSSRTFMKRMKRKELFLFIQKTLNERQNQVCLLNRMTGDLT